MTEEQKAANPEAGEQVFGTPQFDAAQRPVAPGGVPLAEDVDSIDGLRATATARQEARPHMSFTLPKDSLGWTWNSSRPDSDRTFALVQAKPMEQAHAIKIGRDDPDAVGVEMIMQTLVKVGDWSTVRRRDDVLAWWDEIGPEGRTLVQQAWGKIHSPTQRTVATFLATAQPSV